MELSNLNTKNGLCISLGANIDSKFGSPIETLIKCKPKVEQIIRFWIHQSEPFLKGNASQSQIFYWSSIYETSPHGVEDEQPNYLNTLVLVKSNYFPNPSLENGISLLKKFKKLERDFGRQETPPNHKWLSRCLDLDILWWEDLYLCNKELTLPHPRFMNRNFVITPLSEVLSKLQKIQKLDFPRSNID